MPGYHINRTNEDIKRELTLLIRKVKDPRVKDKLFSIVDIIVSNDLSHAKVYISSINGLEKAQNVCDGLNSAAGFLRHELGKNLHIRKSPELVFYADDSIKENFEMFKKIEGKTNDN